MLEAVMKIPPEQKHHYHYFIDFNGDWYCEGNPVVDRELLKILSSSLFEYKSRYYIKCEGEIHSVEVADAPLWIKYVHISVDESNRSLIKDIQLEFTDGREEILDPHTLWLEGDAALYCLATRKRLRARFGKVAYYELARFIEWHEEKEEYIIPFSSEMVVLPRILAP